MFYTCSVWWWDCCSLASVCDIVGLGQYKWGTNVVLTLPVPASVCWTLPWSQLWGRNRQYDYYWLTLRVCVCVSVCVSVCQCESVWVRSSDLVHLMVRLEFTNRVCYWIHSSQCSRGFTVGFWEFYAADKCLFHLVVKYKSSRVSSVEFISVLFFLSVNELTEALFSLRQ